MNDSMTGSEESRTEHQSERLVQAEADLAASQLALADSLEAHGFLESILNASKDCIKVLTFEGDLIFMNDGGKHVMEVDDFQKLIGRPWLGFWEGQGRADAEVALRVAKAGGLGHFESSAATATGTLKYWDVTVSLIPSANSDPGHILSISRDITAMRAAEEQKELLSRELSHRVKNSLSMAQAIAAQTFRGSDSEKLAAYNSRLAALGAAQSLLLQRQWSAISTKALVAGALNPICPPERLDAEIEDFQLDGRRALALAMALHELGTNAMKYGSLSTPTGCVRLRLSTDSGKLEMSWREIGGPSVEQPKRSGFGTRLITRNLETDFDGEVELNYLPTGVVLTLSAPR